MTPTAYLIAAVPVDELEHTVEAIMPTPLSSALCSTSARPSPASRFIAGAGARAMS